MMFKLFLWTTRLFSEYNNVVTKTVLGSLGTRDFDVEYENDCCDSWAWNLHMYEIVDTVSNTRIPIREVLITLSQRIWLFCRWTYVFVYLLSGWLQRKLHWKLQKLLMMWYWTELLWWTETRIKLAIVGVSVVQLLAVKFFWCSRLWKCYCVCEYKSNTSIY